MTSTSQTPPTGSWTISCDGSWTSTDLTIANAPSCPPGQQPSFSTTCAECTEGKYSDSDDTYSCTPCGQGLYNPATGSTSSAACLTCEEPSYSNVEAAAECEVCPANGKFVSSKQCTMEWSVNTFAALYSKIDEYGSDLMGNGDKVTLADGVYSGGTLETVDLFGEVRCLASACVLDGENTNGIMLVFGTGEGVLTLRGLKFYKGYTPVVSDPSPTSFPFLHLSLCHSH